MAARTVVPPSVPRGALHRNPFRTVALILLGAATLSGVWLTYLSLQSGPIPGCEGGECAAVLASKWAKVFGVPVGVFGAAAYLVLCVLGSRPIPHDQRGQRIAAAALVLLVPAAAIWFAGLQIFVLKAFCKWCSVTHAVATIGAVLMILAWRRDDTAPHAAGRRAHRTSLRAPVWGAALGLAAVAFGGFALMQALSPEPPKARVVTASMGKPALPTQVPASTNAPSPSASPAATSVPSTSSPPLAARAETHASPTVPGPRQIVLHDGRFVLDPHDLPCVGSPDARHLVVMISDYTCIHCRHANQILREVREAFPPGQLGTLMLPTQHGGDSLDLQRLMLAAWRLDPEVWSDCSKEIYAERLPQRTASVRPVLEQRLGATRLADCIETNETWFTNLVTLTREILAANREKTHSGSIPQFIMGKEIVVGAPLDAAEFFQLFEQHMGLVRDRFPELHFSTAEFDLGRVFAGTTRTLSVPYTNSGQAPLQVARATLPPGARILRGLQTSVPPGATSELQVSLPAPKEAGPFEQTLTFLSNARPPQAPVRVKGTVWKPIQMSPEFLDLGRLDPSATTTQGVFRIHLDEPARLASVQSKNAGFEAKLLEITPGQAYEVRVSTTPTLGPGVQQGVLVISLEKPAPPGWPETIALAARVTVERAVTAMPQRLVLPPGNLPTERHQQVLVRCTDGTPDFKVSDAVLEGGPGFTQPQIEPVAGSTDVVVRLTLPAGWSVPLPPTSARLVIHTTHTRYPVIEVPLVIQAQ